MTKYYRLFLPACFLYLAIQNDAARGNWGTFAPGNPSSSMNQNLKLLSEAVAVPEPSSLLLLALGLLGLIHWRVWIR